MSFKFTVLLEPQDSDRGYMLTVTNEHGEVATRNAAVDIDEARDILVDWINDHVLEETET